MPDTSNRMIRMVYDGARPIRLILIAVIAGVRITKYFTSLFSATSPKSGLKSAGIRLTISRSATIERESPSFSIISGKSGAKNAEKTSCAKCAKEIIKTFERMNCLFNVCLILCVYLYIVC